MSNESWLAAYLYTNSPWEPLLVDALKPFVEQILEEGLARQYFFIRYWEQGPHIRLRFLGDTRTLEEKVKPRIHETFSEYMRQHPTSRFDDDKPEETERLNLFPNNSIQYIEYEPETKRYGGKVGLPISERQFQASSNACLAAFADADDWGYDKGLGTAIQMHLSMAHAMKFNFSELQDFCNMVSNGWLRRAYDFDQDTTEEEHKARQKEVKEAFEKMFQSQKQVLVPFSQTLWQALDDGVEFEQEWLNEWVRRLNEVYSNLHRAHLAGEIEIPWPEAYFMQGDVPDQRGLWSIVESYVHMTNNRLGIWNQDEAYLGYLISRTIPYLSGEAQLEENSQDDE
ncbi:MAG: thiopeptide-type bacteriocin biosynthesis protein [Acidobacteriota bacterium]|nr:thiopeptide-type bacteriocin biosynthesis protein [Acidobacteriota bacterium]